MRANSRDPARTTLRLPTLVIAPTKGCLGERVFVVCGTRRGGAGLLHRPRVPWSAPVESLSGLSATGTHDGTAPQRPPLLRGSVNAYLALRHSTLLRLRAAVLGVGERDGILPKAGVQLPFQPRQQPQPPHAHPQRCALAAAHDLRRTWASPWLNLGRRLGAGVKPYRCQEPGCGYASSDSGALRRHQRIHTGDKPAKCDWSGCNFSCVLTRLSPLSAASTPAGGQS